MSYFRLDNKTGNNIHQKFDGKCQSCGSSFDVCVHHIERKSIGSADYNDESNLTLLCRSCHMSHHRRTGDISTKGYGRRGSLTIIYCSEPECGLPQHAKKLCKKHYTRLFRHTWASTRY